MDEQQIIDDTETLLAFALDYAGLTTTRIWEADEAEQSLARSLAELPSGVPASVGLALTFLMEQAIGMAEVAGLDRNEAITQLRHNLGTMIAGVREH